MTIQVSREGLSLVAQTSFLEPKARTLEELSDRIEKCIIATGNTLKKSGALRDINVEDPIQDRLVDRINSMPGSLESLAYFTAIAANELKTAIASGDLSDIGTSAYFLGQIRSMFVFERDFGDLTFQGHDFPAQLKIALDFWMGNQSSSEDVWQEFITQRSWLFNMITSSPVVIACDKAYVGGKNIQNTGGSIADYIVKNSLTANATIVEIKKPEARLLGAEYRTGVFAPSSELAGATQQALAYRQNLLQNAKSLHGDDAPTFHAWDPSAVLLVGNTNELTDSSRKRSFELYRSDLRNVRVVTFDELFAGVAALQDKLGDGIVARGLSFRMNVAVSGATSAPSDSTSINDSD